jgi:hypothetical protein
LFVFKFISLPHHMGVSGQNGNWAMKSGEIMVHDGNIRLSKVKLRSYAT